MMVERWASVENLDGLLRIMIEKGSSMKKYTLLIMAMVLLLALPLAVQAQSQSNAALPTACQIEWPKVYLLVDHTRRHIVDWNTFLNLGYLTPDIVPCGDAADDPEGAPITTLFKGSGPEVYLMENGLRRHIPDMDTFTASGFHSADMTVLPDDIVALWPLGTPLASVAAASQDTITQEFSIISYAIRLWHPAQGLHDFATISQLGQPDIRIDDVETIVGLPLRVPPLEVTGDHDPDLIFLIHPNGSAHCCYGTVVYNLGTLPTQVLNILSPAYQTPATGRGDFQDIDGDGRDEFITSDPLTGIPCTQPSVYTILQYDPIQGKYVGATPRFATYRADMIARYLSLPTTSDPCTIYPMVTTLSYLGKTDDAKAAYDRLYRGADAGAYWETLQTAVQHGRFYVPAQ
jgi:hypothetical protein